MDIHCLVTPHGLVPLYDDDYEQKRRLKLGDTVRVHVTRPRNLKFHRKFFEMINTAWEYQSEVTRAFFHDSIDGFRATLTIAAGFYDTVYNVTRGEWIQIPRSISFDKMDETEFSQVYNAVLNVICSNFLDEATKEEFNNILRTF